MPGIVFLIKLSAGMLSRTEEQCLQRTSVLLQDCDMDCLSVCLEACVCVYRFEYMCRLYFLGIDSMRPFVGTNHGATQVDTSSKSIQVHVHVWQMVPSFRLR